MLWPMANRSWYRSFIGGQKWPLFLFVKTQGIIYPSAIIKTLKTAIRALTNIKLDRNKRLGVQLAQDLVFLSLASANMYLLTLLDHHLLKL